MPLENFHPAVAAWFRGAFPAPTPAQGRAWPAIQSGRHALIAAPTGSGKTLAAFLAAIDELVRRGVELPLLDETTVVYVSPLKALSNDVRTNLEAPLAGIRDELLRLGFPDVEIRSSVAHRRHLAIRAHGNAQAAAAYRGDHARIALHPARLRIRPPDAGEHTYRDRR